MNPCINKRLQNRADLGNQKHSPDTTGMVILVANPKLDYNGVFSLPNMSFLLDQVNQAYRAAVVTISKATDFKRAIDMGKGLLKSSKETHLMMCGHGDLEDGIQFGDGDEGWYGIDQVRREDFEGISRVFLNGCYLFQLAKRVVEIAQIPACALMGPGSVSTIFYSEPNPSDFSFKGFVPLGRRDGPCFTFYPDGRQLIPPSLQIFQILREKAERGDSLSSEILSIYYVSIRQEELAIQYAKKASDRPFSQYFLGVYAKKKEAVSLFEKSAQQGHYLSKLELAKIYLSQGKCQDAVSHLQKAHIYSTEAKYLLAICYEKGWGTSQNITYSQRLFTCARQAPNFLSSVQILCEDFAKFKDPFLREIVRRCHAENSK